MSNRKIIVQNFADDQQITVDGIVQVTACADGRVIIDVPGDGIDVDQSPTHNRLVITRKPDPAATAIESTPEVIKTKVMHHPTTVSTSHPKLT